MRTQELYASVTQRIIDELKTGVAPWARPWKDGTRGLTTIPHNAISGRPYSGINVLILYMEAQDKGYETQGWCTFQQSNTAGAKVRKGEKATQVVFVKRIEKEEGGEIKKSTVLKAYPVFNVAQIDNLDPKYTEIPVIVDEEVTYDRALELMRDCGAKVIHGGNSASYNRARDEIVLPPYGSFDSEVDYWGTAFHEITHWSGAKKRLDRQFGKRFGDKAYSFEELVAELGSAFICAQLGIPATFRSAAYLDHWLKVLGEDNRAIFTAASYAGHAAHYITEQSMAVQENTPAVERTEKAEMEDSIPY